MILQNEGWRFSCSNFAFFIIIIELLNNTFIILSISIEPKFMEQTEKSYLLLNIKNHSLSVLANSNRI